MTHNFRVLLIGEHLDQAFVATALGKMTSVTYSSGVWDFTIVTAPVAGVDYFIDTQVDGGITRSWAWPLTDNTIAVQSDQDATPTNPGGTNGTRSNVLVLSTDTIDDLYQRIWHELLHTVPGIVSVDLMNHTLSFSTWLSTNGITLSYYPTPAGMNDPLVNLLTWNRYLTTLARVVYSPPVANFTVSASTIVLHQSIKATDTSTGVPTSWKWELGNGVVTTLQNLPWYYYFAAGTYTLKLTVTNANGSSSKTQTITVNPEYASPSPVLPKYTHNINTNSNNYVYGVQFDEGAEGGTFHDTTPTNEGVAYDGRTESVDTELLEYTGNAPSPTFTHNIAYVRDGEWLKYTVTVNTAGNYNFEYCYASPAVGRSLFIYVDDVLKQTCVLPSTGSFTEWSVYKSKYINQPALNLTAGTHVIKILFAGESQNMLWFNFEYEAAQPVVLTPVAAFSSDVTTGTKPTPVMFTDKSSNNPTSWLWNFGDGMTSSVRNPNHIYETSGIYTVALTATNAVGSDTEVKVSYIIIKEPVVSTVTKPEAMISWDSTTAEVGKTTIFVDHSQNSPTSWLWNFGDGQTSTLRNPTHAYASANTYVVSLTATNAAGSDTYTQNVGISLPVIPTGGEPSPSFKSNPIAGKYTVPVIINFVDTSTADPSTPITSWLWDFGDDHTSTEQNPTHGYITAGTYTVSLTVTNSVASKTYAVYEGYTISTVSEPTEPVVITEPIAACSVNLSSMTVPCVATFTDHSTGTPTSWLWNFDDGSVSTDQNPTHTFVNAGVYSVRLTVANAFGHSYITKTLNLVEAVDGKPKPYFTCSPASGEIDVGTTVQFFDSTPETLDAPNLRWQWFFGDEGYSEEKNPVHKFTKTGTFTVRLMVTNKNGFNSYSIQDCFVVNEVYTAEPIHAAFRAFPSSGNLPLTVTFINDSTGPYEFCDWDFGDGGTSNKINGKHTYVGDEAKDYTVTLTVTTLDGRTSTETIFNCIEASAPLVPSSTPTVDFEVDATGCDITQQLQFTNLSYGGDITSLTWHFGLDNLTSNTQDPKFRYYSPGIYTVRLDVTIGGVVYSHEKKNYIYVTPEVTEPPTAGFTSDTTTGVAPVMINFTDTSEHYPCSWIWNFGDGTYSIMKNPSHQYTDGGLYTVTLTTKNKMGVDQIIKTDYIEVLSTSVVNYCYTGEYEHNYGLLMTRIDTSKESHNQTYRPNAIRCNYGTYEVSIAKLTAAQSEDSQVGLTFNANEVLRIDSNKNLTGLPISGYGVYLDYRYNTIIVKRFGNNTEPVELNEFVIDPLSINKFYTLKVERLVDGYIKVYLNDENIGNVYDTTYTNDGCSGIIIYSKNNGEEFAFDDYVVDKMSYIHTLNSSVYMGGVSHGGKFNEINMVENKFIAGSQFPLGKYYGEVCARANWDAEIIVDYKNFTRDRPITYETYDNLNDVTELKKTHIELGTNKSTYNMKIDLDSTNDRGCVCGIVVRENDTAYKRNYKPVVVVEYIALAPVASNANENMFPQDVAMMCYTKPSTYQKLENKRVW